jgi:hypothetical protein
MTYPNAHRGIEKIHVAEILLIIGGAILTIEKGIMADDGLGSIVEQVGVSLKIIILVMLIIGLVLSLVGDVFNLWGLKIASRDDKKFLIPFYLTLAIMVADVVLSIVLASDQHSMISEIMEEVEEVIELLQMIIVIIVSSRLAASLNGTKQVKFGNAMMIIIIVAISFAVVSGIITVFAENLKDVMDFVAALLETVSFIVYLVFVDKTIKFLEKN